MRLFLFENRPAAACLKRRPRQGAGGLMTARAH